MEKWLPVLNYEAIYEVSDFGRVRNKRTKRILSGSRGGKDPRPSIGLWEHNIGKTHRIHNLVLTAFRGPKPAGLECCHNDGNCTNNALPNLRWDTHANNLLDRISHGTYQFGEQNPVAKLTTADVLKIRDDPRTQRIVAEEYGIGQVQVSRIKRRTRWGHI